MSPSPLEGLPCRVNDCRVDAEYGLFSWTTRLYFSMSPVNDASTFPLPFPLHRSLISSLTQVSRRLSSLSLRMLKNPPSYLVSAGFCPRIISVCHLFFLFWSSVLHTCTVLQKDLLLRELDRTSWLACKLASLHGSNDIMYLPRHSAEPGRSIFAYISQ